MATEKIERELRTRLRELLGDVAAMALFEKFPPDGWASRFDAIDARFDELEVDMDRRFAAVDRRFDAVEARFDRHEDRFDALAHQLTAAFRGELNAAITAQTRSMIFGLLGAMAGVGGLSLAIVGVAT